VRSEARRSASRAYEERNPERKSRKRSGAVTTPEQRELKRERDRRHYAARLAVARPPKPEMPEPSRFPGRPCCAENGATCLQHKAWQDFHYRTKGRVRYLANPLSTPEGESLAGLGFSVHGARSQRGNVVA
jgi:hypothetical protein